VTTHKFFTLKSEGFHSWISSSVFFNLRTRCVHNPARHYNRGETGITIVQYKNTKILGLKNKRQISSVQSADRGSLVDSRQMCESNRTIHSSVTCISKNMYETRTDKWHTAWINPRVPSLEVDTERDFHPVVSSFHQKQQSQKRRFYYLVTVRHYSHTRDLDVITLARENHVEIISLPLHNSHKMYPWIKLSRRPWKCSTPKKLRYSSFQN